MRHHHQINELSDFDIWGLKMAVMIIHNKKYQCQECVKRSDQSLRDASLGCSGFKTPRKLNNDSPWLYSKCIGNFYNIGFSNVVDLYYKYKDGMLAEDGGYLNQPAKYLNAMAFVGSEITTIEMEKMKALQTKQKTNSRMSHGRK